MSVGIFLPMLLTLKKASFQGFGLESPVPVIKSDGFSECQSALVSSSGSVQRTTNFIIYVV